MASTICLIEDDDLLGETLCDRFRLEGLEFEWFKEGRRALEALKRRAFAVVLCDLRLPDGSGAEVFEALESTLRPPFVFMTGFGSIDEAVAL
jgi:DNA-binding NtrC family response regulator